MTIVPWPHLYHTSVIIDYWNPTSRQSLTSVQEKLLILEISLLLEVKVACPLTIMYLLENSPISLPRLKWVRVLSHNTKQLRHFKYFNLWSQWSEPLNLSLLQHHKGRLIKWQYHKEIFFNSNLHPKCKKDPQNSE